MILESIEMMEIEVLDESGGILSWVKRALTSVDMSLIQELDDEIAKVETEVQRHDVIRAIDTYLRDADYAADMGSIGAVFAGIGLGVMAVPTGVIALSFMAKRLATMLVGGIALGISSGIITIVCRLVVLHNGTLDNYRDALIVAKKKIEALKLPRKA